MELLLQINHDSVTKDSCDEQNQHIAIMSEQDRASVVRDEVVELESTKEAVVNSHLVGSDAEPGCPVFKSKSDLRTN
jgi:hypothetical protein